MNAKLPARHRILPSKVRLGSEHIVPDDEYVPIPSAVEPVQASPPPLKLPLCHTHLLVKLSQALRYCKHPVLLSVQILAHSEAVVVAPV